MEYYKKMFMLIAFFGMVIISVILVVLKLYGYSIFTFTISLVLMCAVIYDMFHQSSPDDAYKHRINRILNTYDSILVETKEVPDLAYRNVIITTSIEDLVDAQVEIRKPICYIMNDKTCSFVLLDEKEAFVYYDKLDDKYISLVEKAIENKRKKMEEDKKLDSELLDSIDRTTIIKLSNLKAYKVSPIIYSSRKKKEEIEYLDF